MYIQVIHDKQSLSKSHATHYSCKTTHYGDWHIHTHHSRMQGKSTVIVVQGSFGVMKLHFRVLDSEPLVVRSLDRMLLWVLPVKNCIGLQTTGQSHQQTRLQTRTVRPLTVRL